VAAAVALATGATAATVQPPHWLAAWIAPPIGYEPKIKDALGRPFRNETARQTLRVMAGGDSLRVRLTNELGTDPLRIGGASIARLRPDGTLIPGSVRPLLFAGRREAVIPAGAPFYSDPIGGPVAAGTDFAVSIYYPDESAPPAHAQMLEVAAGDATAREQLVGARTVRASGIVSAIEVASPSPGRRVLVAFGDSITEGAGATPAAGPSSTQESAATGCSTTAGDPMRWRASLATCSLCQA
jgi:hypothetical protein